MSMTRRVVLVTGASGGIGEALARVFAQHGHDLCLVARSQDKLDALADALARGTMIRPLVFVSDLAEPGAVAALVAKLADAGVLVETLVNNAGYGLVGEVGALDCDEQLGIIDLNVRALVELTIRLIPQITAARGGILNVASIAAYLPGPGMANYYASKAYVRSFTLALWQELRKDGVSVTLLCPGMTLTGFQARAKMQLGSNLNSFAVQSAMQVAEAGYAGLVAKRRVIVPGYVNSLFTKIVPYLPYTLLLPLVARVQGMKSKGT
jgi:short-subunit dehydrogenase